MNYWQPYSLEFLNNPYPFYKVLRDEAPIYKATNGDIMITRYGHVKDLLKKNALSYRCK